MTEIVTASFHLVEGVKIAFRVLKFRRRCPLKYREDGA